MTYREPEPRRTSAAPREAPPGVLQAALETIQSFLRLEAAGGIVLLACAAAALAWANAWPGSYHALLGWTLRPGPLPAVELHALVNDGLMTLFFLVVGLEIKRELARGELRSPSQALLPAVAAAGGMVVPAAIFLAVNAGGPGAAGWGIPMATDIAFCVGVLALLRSRVPRGLVVFVTALAIFDDIGGILVIALFYGAGISLPWLLGAAAVAAAAAGMGRLRGLHPAAWLAPGVLLWWTLHGAGIHATLAGVALGLLVPAGAPEGRRPPLDRLEHALHPWVAFGVMPLFALVNAGVDLSGLSPDQLAGRVTLGTAAALLLGKPLGITAFTLAAVRLGLARLPAGTTAPKLAGAGIVAGIGFTVALFIAGLAYPGAPALLDEAKVGILASSLLAGVLGAAVLLRTRRVEGP